MKHHLILTKSGSVVPDPPSLPESGLQLQLESLLISGLADNDPVDSWDDDENSISATGSGDSRPLYIADAGEGVPAVRFDGVDDFLSMGNPFSIGDQMTIFVMLSRPNTISGGRQTVFGQQDAGGGFQLEVQNKQTQTIISGSFVSLSEDIEEAADDEVQLLMYSRSGAGSGTHQYRGNALNSDIVTDGVGSYSGDGIKEIGRRLASVQMFEGDIYAIVIYDRQLTAEEMAEVENYLGSRYQAHLGQHLVLEHQGTGALSTGGNKIQGVAVDNNGDFWTNHSENLPSRNFFRKWTETALDAYTIDDTYETTSDYPSGATQQNQISFKDGALWVGLNNWQTEPKLGWIQKYNLSGALQETYPTAANWNEGGAWRGDEFFVVNHDALTVHRYNSSFALQGVHSLPDMGVPYEDDLLAQGAIWFGNQLICPHHNGDGDSFIYIYKWTGSAFTEGSRIKVCVSANESIPDLGQGICWRDPVKTPELGDECFIARRLDTGDGELIRCKVGQRWGPSGIVPEGPPLATPENPTDANLVAWWPLDEASGTRADSHSGGHDLADDSSVGSGAGRLSDAAIFASASADSLSNGDAALRLNGATKFSLACWVKRNGGLYFPQFIAGNFTETAGYGLYKVDGKIGFYIWKSGQTTVALANKAMVDDQWYHVCGTWDAAGNQTLYIDGIAQNQTTQNDAFLPAASQEFRVGNVHYAASNRYWDGSIDEVSLWNDELTPGEVAWLVGLNGYGDL